MIYNQNRIFNMAIAPNEREEEWRIVQQFVSSLVRTGTSETLSERDAYLQKFSAAFLAGVK